MKKNCKKLEPVRWTMLYFVEAQKNHFPQFYLNGFLMKLWTTTSIWVLVLFWFMVRKALFGCFKNISYEISLNFLIFEKNLISGKRETHLDKTSIGYLHGLISYTFMWVSNQIQEFSKNFLKWSAIPSGSNHKLFSCFENSAWWYIFKK